MLGLQFFQSASLCVRYFVCDVHEHLLGNPFCPQFVFCTINSSHNTISDNPSLGNGVNVYVSRGTRGLVPSSSAGTRGPHLAEASSATPLISAAPDAQ